MKSQQAFLQRFVLIYVIGSNLDKLFFFSVVTTRVCLRLWLLIMEYNNRK